MRPSINLVDNHRKSQNPGISKSWNRGFFQPMEISGKSVKYSLGENLTSTTGNQEIIICQMHLEMSISNISRDKSFVDDLNKEQGIVSMRVGSALRSTEIKPSFPDLWKEKHTQLLLFEFFVFQLTNQPRGARVQASLRFDTTTPLSWR